MKPRLTRDLSTPENREFWEFVERTSREVRSWPAWKRGREETPRRKGEMTNEHDAMRAKIARLEEEKAALRYALKPFAECGAKLGERDRESDPREGEIVARACFQVAAKIYKETA